jgi:uncharacterized protein
MLFFDSKLIIFSKAPIPGQVNTRLIPVLGADGAAKLHQDMLEQKLRMTHDKQIAPIELYCWPDKHHPYFQQISSRFTLKLHSQTGADLGKRMASALQQALSNYRQAVIIGTDCPPLDQQYLTEAFQALTQGADAVIGPASDGGYVLLGLSRFDQTIFEGIDWGKESVFSQTIARLRQLEFNYVELTTLWDVDTPDDLIRYNQYLASS